MNQGGDIGLGVRMALAAAVSAVVVAALTIVVGRTLITEAPTDEPERAASLVLVAR